VSEDYPSHVEERLDVLSEWDADALLDALGITSQEILDVPKFKNRAKQWIEENG
jgi:hypothetical protein